jgi:hypothetical protein
MNTTTNTDLTVATTILAQLGDRMFTTMTGASQFLGGPDSLQFKVGSGAKSGINKCRIVLDASDTYTVSFYRVRAGKCTTVSETSAVYDDQLRAVFTAATAFRTSL